MKPKNSIREPANHLLAQAPKLKNSNREPANHLLLAQAPKPRKREAEGLVPETGESCATAVSLRGPLSSGCPSPKGRVVRLCRRWLDLDLVLWMRHLDLDLALVLWMRHLDFDLVLVLWMRHLDLDFDRVLWMRHLDFDLDCALWMRHLDLDLVLWMRHLDFDLVLVLWTRHLDLIMTLSPESTAPSSKFASASPRYNRRLRWARGVENLET